MLKRTFTRREIILMLLLALIALAGLYFYAVHYPIVNRMAQIDAETEDVLFQTDVANVRLGLYNSMKAELEEIFAMPEDQLTVMPAYDNFQTLLRHFNTIFEGHEPVLNFDTVKMNGNIAERTVRFTFSAQNWPEAREILTRLTGTGYRCLLDSLSFTPVEQENREDAGDVQNSPLKVTGSITFYELVG